jgi:uncharacterized protein (TIGR02118 family)
MATTITVLYPAEPDATFDIDYYKNTYMPMVLSKLQPYGMTGYTISKLSGTPDPSKPSPYSICSILNFSSGERISEALAKEGSAIIGDVKNFSNKPSIMLLGSVVA